MSPSDLYLDTVTLYTWARLGLADQILSRIHIANSSIHVENVVADEAAKRFGGAVGQALLQSTLHKHGILIEELLELHPGLYESAVDLARWMRDDQLKADPELQLPRSANLGEATTIAYIAALDPQGVFVTSDRQAEDIARRAGVAVARTGAFIHVEILKGGLNSAELWAGICDTGLRSRPTSMPSSRGMSRTGGNRGAPWCVWVAADKAGCRTHGRTGLPTIRTDRVNRMMSRRLPGRTRSPCGESGCIPACRRPSRPSHLDAFKRQ